MKIINFLYHTIVGQLPPRPQEIVPQRMELPADFPDEYKKIGSKRSKFLDLGLPIPKPKVVIVKEYEPANEGTSTNRRFKDGLRRTT